MTITDLPTASYWRRGDPIGARQFVDVGPVALELGGSLPQATVAYGDKAVGTNHVLPTMRAARYTGGLWVGKFLKTCTYQRLTEEGTRRIAPAVAAISLAERFEGHALTATMRLDRLGHPQPA